MSEKMPQMPSVANNEGESEILSQEEIEGIQEAMQDIINSKEEYSERTREDAATIIKLIKDKKPEKIDYNAISFIMENNKEFDEIIGKNVLMLGNKVIDEINSPDSEK